MCSTKPANLRTLIQNPHGKRKVYIPAGNPLTYTHTVLYGMCVHIHTIQQRNKYTQESFLLGIAEQGIRAGILQTIFLVSNHIAGAVLGSTVTTTLATAVCGAWHLTLLTVPGNHLAPLSPA